MYWPLKAKNFAVSNLSFGAPLRLLGRPALAGGVHGGEAD
jgi:hypothetical protein